MSESVPYIIGAFYWNRRDWQNKTPYQLIKQSGFSFYFLRPDGSEWKMTDCVFEDMILCEQQLSIFEPVQYYTASY